MTGTDLVIAEGLDFGTGGRRVYAGLSFTIPAESLAVVLGAEGSGKSVLLLALIGRARKIHGSLQVAGLDAINQARKLRRISTAARIGNVIKIESRHSVLDAVRDRAAFEGVSLSAAEQNFRKTSEILELAAPPDHLVEDLSAYQQTVLSVALACMQANTLLVLDDADRYLKIEDQQRLYTALGSLIAETGSTVIASSVEPDTIPDDAVAIQLLAPGATEQHDR